LTVLLSVAFACVALGIVCLQARMELVAVSKQANLVAGKAGAEFDVLHGVTASIQSKIDGLDVGHVNSAIVKVNTTLDIVNRQCGKQPCGTLADVAKTLNTVRGTFGQIEVAANHEDKQLATLDAQERTMFGNVNDMVTAANSSVGHFDALITSPDVTKTLANVNVSTAAIADSSKQADAILTDGRKEADKLANPPKRKMTFWTATMAAGDYARHFMPSIF
jgi:ABC-type transporter Mla subunit MlaD